MEYIYNLPNSRFFDFISNPMEHIPEGQQFLSGLIKDHTLKTWDNGHLTTKKILVLSNKGGGGHLSSAEAVKKALSNPYYEVDIDFSFDQMSGNDFFNQFQKNGNVDLLEQLTKMQEVAEWTCVPFQIRPLLIKKLNEFKPDLIISVFPIGNKTTWELAKLAKIPMLVLTTDIACQHFFRNFEDPGKDFHVGIPFDDPLIKSQLPKFKDHHFEVIGYPLREAFGKSAIEMSSKIKEIRQELNIKDDDKIVLVMMGAQGVGNLVSEYSKTIACSPFVYEHTIHVVALCGSDEKKNETEKYCSHATNPQVTMHALGRKDADYIAALMRMGNVLVSKPGGSTVNEAIASGIFTLFNSSANRALPWEEGNMNYTIAKGLGEEIKTENFLEQINQALEKPRPAIGECPGKQFNENLVKVVSNIFKETPLETNKTNKTSQIPKDLSKDKRNFLDDVIISICKRELREAIQNLLKDEDIKELKSIYREHNGNVPLDHPRVLKFFSEIASKEYSSEKIMNRLYPVEAEFPRNVENYILNGLIYMKGQELIEKYHPHMMQSLFEILNEEELVKENV